MATVPAQKIKKKRNSHVKRKRLTLTKLLQAAREVFDKQGLDKTVIKDITQEANVAYGTFYNYFETIEEIVESVIAEILLGHAKRVRKYTSSIQDKSSIPAVGLKAVFHLLKTDTAAHWLQERPQILVKELTQTIGPFAIEDISKGIEGKELNLPCSPKALMNFLPWMYLGTIDKKLSLKERYIAEKEVFNIYLRILGIDDKNIKILSIKYDNIDLSDL